jgi:RNA polymerase sigma-70 factor (ECF subfamily)
MSLLTPIPALRPTPAPERDDEPDASTLRRAQRGDRAAQAALIERYQQPVFALLWRIAGPERAVVEDLAQETFLRMLAALPRFEPSGKARLVTWILTIATRLAINHLRATGTAGRGRAGAVVPPGGAPSAMLPPDQDAERRTLAEALVSAIEALGPQYRAAFLLRELHGLRYEEIADTLEVDVGTVKSRLSRARALLQRALAELHDDE